LSSFYDEELSAIGQYSRRSLRRPMKRKFSARETKRSTGRLPRRPAESVPHRNTLGGGERGSLAPRVRRTLRRASRTTSSHTPRGARTARRFSQHHSRDYSGPHAGVRLDGTLKTRAHPTFRGRERSLFNGMRDFPRRSSRRARARRELRARGTRAGARFARLRARASVDRASREVPRVSRRARAAQRGPPLSHAECASTNTRKRRTRSRSASRGSVLESFPPQGVSLSRPFGFPERDRNRVKGNPKGNFWFHRERNKALASRSRFLDPRRTRFSRRSFS
jgi:hypothetical protein